MTSEELKTKFSERFPEHTNNCRIDKEHVVVDIPLEKIEELITALKDESEFDFGLFMDLTVVDWLDRKPRFDLVYHLYSVEHNHRIRLKVGLEDGQQAPTLTGLWPVADWLEREMWDTYGIKFTGHPNLKRILMYDEFKGHPLRRDYPYNKRQPRLSETFPSQPYQVQVEGLKIHRG